MAVAPTAVRGYHTAMDAVLDPRLVLQAQLAAAAAEKARREMLDAAVLRQEAILGMSANGASVRQIAAAIGCSPAVVQSSLERARGRRPRLRGRENHVAYELHLAVTQKLLEDPVGVVQKGLLGLERMRERPRGPVGEGWTSRWEELLKGDLEELRKRMLATDEEAEDLRQMSPFMGVLDDAERRDAIRKAKSLAAR